MAKMRQYKVTFYPASQERGYRTFILQRGKSYPEHEFEAAGFGDMMDEIKVFADDHGKPCLAVVKCLSVRKPPGFDRATKDLYFNLREQHAGS